MIKYFVRTTNERTLDESFSQIEYELLIDKEHKPVESFIKQLELISDYDAVLLEDDLILCKDFKNQIEDVISQYPNKIINFFTYPKAYFKTEESFIFMYNQCTYYPKGVGKKLAIEMLKDKGLKCGYDVIENRALMRMKITHIRYRPCLVQHMDNNSLISNSRGHRRTIWFKDYLDELGISYDEAYTNENKAKLKALLDRMFNHPSTAPEAQ